MKHKLFKIGIGIAGISPAFAIEPPPDDAPPPPSVESRQISPAIGSHRISPDFDISQTPSESTAFLGLVSKEVPELLSTHVGLESGEGVLISLLVPGGPAETAGFEQFDIIRRLAGNPINSPAELSNQLSFHKPGDQIDIDIIHRGKEISKSVTLGSRPADNRLPGPSIADSGGIDLENFGSFTPSQLDRIQRIIGRNLQVPERIEMGQIQPNLNDRIREMQEKMADMQDLDQVQPDNKRFRFKSSTTLSIADDQGGIEIQSHNGNKDVTVRDAENKTIWSGPWNTDEDKAKAPAEIRERVEKLNFSDNMNRNGFRFQFGR